MFGGEGAYVPHPSSAVDMKLRLHEIINAFDIGLVAHPARALLDSGMLQETQAQHSIPASIWSVLLQGHTFYGVLS